MNTNFREHVTSTAFSLTLSKRMCLAIIAEALGNKDVRVHLNMTTYHALEDRGLVYWVNGDLERKREFGGLTREGKIVADLLQLAGMTVESLLPARWE